GERLEQPERAGAGRAEAKLHAAEQLALDPRQGREEDEPEVDDDHGLEERDPPGLIHFDTSTVPSRPPACSAGTRATPVRRDLLTRTRSVADVPFDVTAATSPVESLLFFASVSESSISACGRWN